MSMYNDINWLQNKKESVCRENAIRVAPLAKNFKPGRWSFLGLGHEEKRYGSLIVKPTENGTAAAESMMQEFAESRHLVFRC